MDTVKKITEQIEDGTITTTTRTPGKPSTANFIDAAYDERWPGKSPAPTIINPAGNNPEGKLQTHSNLKTNNMKELPILFSTPMVSAILEGRKTITRRIVKFPTDYDGTDVYINGAFGIKYSSTQMGGTVQRLFPKWQTGNILYVREAWSWDWADYPARTKKYYFFKTSGDDTLATGEKWKPSIHLPKIASRIWLEVTDVRAERLHNITEEDARAEGVANGNIFRSLWQQINGNWDVNPWVWVISFKVLSTTGKPKTQNP